MATLDEFLATGRLGEIATGVSAESVRGILGEPDDVSVKKHPEIWKYGALQLVCIRDVQDLEPYLESISLYFHNPTDRIPPALALTGWLPTHQTDIREFRDHLSDMGLQVQSNNECSPSDYLVLTSNVRATFSDGRLYNLFYAQKRDLKTKQLTVTIPLEDLNLLRQEAARRRLSMSALCSQWIRERVSDLQKIGTP